LFLAHAQAFVGAAAVDVALDIEQHVDGKSYSGAELPKFGPVG
jgi:hypothetical protein